MFCSLVVGCRFSFRIWFLAAFWIEVLGLY